MQPTHLPSNLAHHPVGHPSNTLLEQQVLSDAAETVAPSSDQQCSTEALCDNVCHAASLLD